MNQIESEITTSDRVNARNRRKSAATYAEDILERLRHAAPFSTTFLHSIPTDGGPIVEAELQKQFESWANCWIAPLCREIIAKQTP